MVNYITGRWATKYKYLPDDIRFEGSCEERIQHLKARGYGLYSNIGHGIVWWQQNCHTAVGEYQSKEKQRLADIEEKRLADIEEKRLANIEEKRLADIEEKRLADIEEKRLADIEEKRLADIKEKRLLDLSIKSQELESFYEIDESSKVESIPSIDSMSKQIPLETTAPILLILGIGLVSYYLLKGKK